MIYSGAPILRTLAVMVAIAMLLGVVQAGFFGYWFLTPTPESASASAAALPNLSPGVVLLAITGALFIVLLLVAMVAIVRTRRLTQFCELAMSELAQPQYELETQLRCAVMQLVEQPNSDTQLELYFQPLVDNYTHSVVSFEALLRWHHPERGIVSPSEFISLAEETGLIVDIGLWVVAQAHEQIREWDRQGFTDTTLSINISTRQLRDVADVKKLVASLRVKETSRLTLEITETLLIANQDLYRDFLRQARGLGAKIALDDFGTGFSSLSYLRDYRFDVLKIDRMFVRGLGMDDGVLDEQARLADRNLVASIISLGKTLGLEVVAEGVEHKEELEALAELGCGVIQGFYFGQPMVAAEALRYLSRASSTGYVHTREQAMSI